MPDDPNGFARDLFDGLPARYDRLAELLSFGQNGQWRAEMVSHVVPADGVILDVASGTVMISSIFRETIQEYLSTASFHPIVNGVGSLVPPFYLVEAAEVQDFPAPASMAAVRSWGVRSVIVQTTLVAGTTPASTR